MTLAFPKPKDQKRQPVSAVIVYRDRREVCNRDVVSGKAEYERRITLMWERQNHTCCLCLQSMRREAATFEHEAGRGHGGGHRDDRITFWDGTKQRWINGAAHASCNGEKGSKRVSYNP